MSLQLRPVTFSTMKEFISEHHRHHPSPHGWKFGIGLENEDKELVGVAVVGRPVARNYDDGYTAEVTRLAVKDNVKNGCSKLYAACWRAARAMGYKRILTYILKNESGTSVKAAGWEYSHTTDGGSWSRKNRKRKDKHPTCKKHCFKQGEWDDTQ